MTQIFLSDEEELDSKTQDRSKMYCSYCNEEMLNKGKLFECPICESTYKTYK